MNRSYEPDNRSQAPEPLYRAALNIWSSRKKWPIVYDSGTIQTQNGTEFTSQITIRFLNYKSYATGPNKKAAANLAAFDYLKYLYNNKYLDDKELSNNCYHSLNVKESIIQGAREALQKNGNVTFSIDSSQYHQYQQQQQFLNNSSQGHRPSPKQNHEPVQQQQYIPEHWDHPHQPISRTDKSSSQQQYARQCPQTSQQYQGSSQNNNKNYQKSYDSPKRNYDNDSNTEKRKNCNEFASKNYPPPSKDYSYSQAPPPPMYGNWYNNNMHENKKQRKGTNGNGNWNNNPQSMNNYPNYYNRNNSSASTLDEMLKSVGDMKRNYSSYNQIDDVSKLEEIGGFTLENSKHLLGNFFLTNHIKTDYTFSEEGPAHMKIFTATLNFNVRGKHIRESARAKSKQDASRVCAFKTIRKLYQDGLIKAFTTMISKRSLMKMNYIYCLDVSSKLKDLLILNYKIVQTHQQVNPQYDSPFNSMHNSLTHEASINEVDGQPNYLYWCPPLENFDPWTGKMPLNPLYCNKTFDEINSILNEKFLSTIKNQRFQEILEQRKNLPIFAVKELVMNKIQEHPVLLIKGSTGSGKTTQVPQFILDTYLKNKNGANCNIIVTQPRRISAISLSERIAYERLENFGYEGESSVGYSVRFEHQYPRPYGSIMFCTTGHLLRRLSNGLRGVSHIIIDEVHERDINTDCLLVLVRDLIRMGLGIRVIIMSATVGIKSFKDYFDNCHVLEIEGNIFPVERYYLEDIIEIIKWRPNRLTYVEESETDEMNEFCFENDKDNERDNIMNMNVCESERSYSSNTLKIMSNLKEGLICYELIASILEYIYQIDQNGNGAVLIFLPGWQAIFSLVRYLERHHLFGDRRKFYLLPLHSRLSSKDNQRVFERTNARKIILSTNIAETSITIDDIVFVIDSCLMKRKIYDSWTNVTNYVVDWVSKSNIEQRKGRAGRLRNGYFFALCSKRRYESLEPFKIPEILSTSLIEICLLVKYLGFHDVSQFISKLIDSPSSTAVQQALRVLQDINAFDGKNTLTPLGRILINMPMDPRLGKMIIQATLLNVGSPAVTIAAASSISYELFDYSNLESIGYELMRMDGKNFSDHWLSFKVYEDYERGKLDEFSRVNRNALIQLRNARKQLVDTLCNSGFSPYNYESKDNYSKAEVDTCLSLLITAFYPNICAFAEGRRMITNEKKIGLIHKNSVIYSYIYDRVIDRLTNIPSPLFVYTEKSKFQHIISCKQLTMINFLQLLLFGVQKYEYSTYNDQAIILDGWLEVKIDHEIFDCVWVFRNEFDKILMKTCQHPNYCFNDKQFEMTIFNTIKFMCSNDEVKFHLENKPENNSLPQIPGLSSGYVQ